MNAPNSGMSGLGVDSADDLSSRLGEPAKPTAGGGPLMIDINLIDEDPRQPRTRDNPGFAPKSIADLAGSFGPKGPKSPLSIRPHPEAPGRYIINHGHRRYRAGVLKGLATLPAFIDNEYDDFDQIVENLQREGNTHREMADWIGRKLAEGLSQKQVAARIGKSVAFVSQYVTLLDLPEPIADAFNAGRVNDVTLINDLVRAFKRNRTEVAQWLNNASQEITRGEVRLLREYLAEKRHEPDTVDAFSGQNDGEASEGANSGIGAAPTKAPEADPWKLKKTIVQVEHDGRKARLVLTKRPPADGYAWLMYEDGGHELEARLEEVKLLAIIEG